MAEGSFERSREAFAQAEEWLAGPEAAELDHAGLEEELAGRGREIQRLLLQDHLDTRAAAEQRLARVDGPDRVTRSWAERGHDRTLASIFGPVTVTRIAYRGRGVPNVHLADGQLNMPAGKHSHGLAKMTAAACAAGSLGQACALVRERTGFRAGDPAGPAAGPGRRRRFRGLLRQQAAAARRRAR